jgi:hypothetical protein
MQRFDARGEIAGGIPEREAGDFRLAALRTRAAMP